MRPLIPFLLACGAVDAQTAPETDADTDDTASTSPADDDLPFATHPFVTSRWANVAHRGGAWLGPEQTLPTYQAAVTAGARVLEIDVATTSDGVIVCLHDETLNRTTDVTALSDVDDPTTPVNVADRTWAEIQTLDAGYWYVQGEGVDEGDDRGDRPPTDFPARGTGVRVPTLAEILGAFAADPDVLFSVEIKQVSPSIVDPVLAELDAAGVIGRSVVGSFDDATLAEVRAKRADVLTTMGVAEGLRVYGLQPEDADDYVPPTRFFAAPIRFPGITITGDDIARIQGYGVIVHLWTINDEPTMRQAFDWGAAGVITDDVVTLQTVIDDLAP